jgi:TonB family protein
VADANAKESLPVQDSQDSVDLRQSSPLPASLAMHEKKRGWTDPYRFGLAASVTIMIVGAVALWPFRANVFHHTLSNDPAHANVDSASSPAVALPAEHVGVVAPSSDAPITESPEPAPVEDVQEYPTMPSPPDGAMSAPSDPAKNTTPVVPKINRRTSSKTPLFPANEIHPRNHATMPAQSEQPPMEPPNSNLEGGNVLPGAGIDGGKIFPLELKTQGNPVTATGSIEIVSDPYPSIRVPSGTQGRKSRPGTSLQIGRLTSKIEPLYPAEALGQRVAGRVRVHVLIGRNGSIERAELVEGPALLTETALRDVQQLHFEPTLLGGMAIEVEEDITVIFHIANSPSAAN